MHTQKTLLITVLTLGIGWTIAETKLGSSLKAATANATSTAEAAKKKAEDSAKAVTAAKVKKAEDSAKAVAASVEAAARKTADSLKAVAEAALKMKKEEPKTEAPVAKPVAEVKTEAAPTAPAKKAVGTAKIAFGTSVESRELKGEGTEFEPGSVSTWTRLSLGGGAVKVKHVWYKGDKKITEIALTSQSGNGRVWSNVHVTSGKWKVELQSESGEVLASGEFTVK